MPPKSRTLARRLPSWRAFAMTIPTVPACTDTRPGSGGQQPPCPARPDVTAPAERAAAATRHQNTDREQPQGRLPPTRSEAAPGSGATACIPVHAERTRAWLLAEGVGFEDGPGDLGLGEPGLGRGVA